MFTNVNDYVAHMCLYVTCACACKVVQSAFVSVSVKEVVCFSGDTTKQNKKLKTHGNHKYYMTTRLKRGQKILCKGDSRWMKKVKIYSIRFPVFTYDFGVISCFLFTNGDSSSDCRFSVTIN